MSEQQPVLAVCISTRLAEMPADEQEVMAALSGGTLATGTCGFCGELVALAPSSVEHNARIVAAGQPLMIVCLGCLPKHWMTRENSIRPPGSSDELRHAAAGLELRRRRRN